MQANSSHEDDRGPQFSASLRLHSTELSVEEIQASFGSAAARVTRKGEPVSRRAPGYPLRAHSTCVYESTARDDEPLERHFESVLSVAEPRVSGLRELLDRGA